MRRGPRKISRSHVFVALALVAGLLVGWLVIGWWLWPVEWANALPVDLSPQTRSAYLDLVAESYARSPDAELAQERLSTFPAEQQAALLADIEKAAVQAPEASSAVEQPSVAQSLAKTENILVLGQDHRPDWEMWHTDSIMVIAIDREHNQVGVISIPRDLYVDIPGYKSERINVADYVGEKKGYPGGGPALASRVISETLGIPTQHYVRVHMNALVKLVDALGGVTVNLDCPLYERTPKESSPTGYEEWTLPAGKVTLDGDEARKFATYRYASSDFSRTKRQQQLIWAIRNRALEVNLISRIPQLWAALADLFTTDFSPIDAARLAKFGAGLDPSRVHGLTFSYDAIGNYTTPEGQMVLVVKDRAALEAEKEQLFLRKPLSSLGKIEAGEECPAPPE
jgi:polyisoprenyl-teichoic acid--peptidoglycan teichoic acid transferase